MRTEYSSFFRARILYLSDTTGDFITDVMREFIQSCFGMPVTLELLSLGTETVFQNTKSFNYVTILLLIIPQPTYNIL